MHHNLTHFTACSALLIAGSLAVSAAGADEGPYKPTWESLSRHQAAPEWFQDAKLGIYFHWGAED